ncbi:ABC transporter ATP-binding protein [Hoyosella rhizosphaerae]|uniref:ABC transporter ATP-binding protein n=1 Tax=Hoyosella rhizosphaerae TaxID=1755582 RepID=A0A916X9K0_9ACTN|nr:ATP-binding cassette domain-containing protein [Hoyosella rhizosphaerae]MBN4926980.1 ABC transporter ATP-binding protein [Hoyosella rhizosphaerae]GGC54976.1 ABC transporter ATP-binding protein [Hoyosella rhizosphaerae]
MSSDVHIPHLIVRHRGTALADVSDIRLEPGTPTTIIGESGSGKSILAHGIMGSLPRTLTVEGELHFDGRKYNLRARATRKLWGRRFALLPQEPMLALDPTMRVRRQVAEGAQEFRSSATQALAKADASLTHLGLAHTAQSYPHTLSGGMAQRVTFAAASIGGAEVLIVDEPTKGLDTAAVDRLADLLIEHADRGGVLLTITHDLRLARRLGGQVLVMKDASVVERGPADQVLSSPDHPYSRRLVGAEPSHWQYPWQVTPPPAYAEELVNAREISKSYGDMTLFESLNIHIRAGERLALTGPSGAGKTTLGNALVGLTPVDHGDVTLSPTVEGVRRQKLYQDPAVSFPRRVRLELALRDVCKRHHIPEHRLETLLAEVGLNTAIVSRHPNEVSGGELQRLAIVRAMLVEPALIFVDEATSRLDLITQETTINCLMTELERTRCALLLVTHDHDLAEATTHRRLELGATPEVRAEVGATAQ